MDFVLNFLRGVFEKIPYQVVLSIFVVIVFTELTKKFLSKIEKRLEEKKGKEIKFFDHTKIIFSLFWTAVLIISFAFGKIITWGEFVLFFLFVIGGATVFYELVIKKIKELKNKAYE